MRIILFLLLVFTFSCDGLLTNRNSEFNSVKTGSENQQGIFSSRADHKSLVFDDHIFIIGGTNGKKVFENVFMSENGSNWTEVQSSEEKGISNIFLNRKGYEILKFQNKLWVIGGYYKSNFETTNDIYSSENGIFWKKVSINTIGGRFLGRNGHQVVVFNDNMYIIGGYGINPHSTKKNTLIPEYMNNVWASPDGSTWIEITKNAAFSRRDGHQVVVFDDKMFLIGGGLGSNGGNDVWSSQDDDGNNWNELTITGGNARSMLDIAKNGTLFEPRTNHVAVVFKNEIFVIGGYAYYKHNDDTGKLDAGGWRLNDVWKSSDGATWTKVTRNAAFPGRSNHQVVVRKVDGVETMFLIGGRGKSSYYNDVWSSTDGKTWTQVKEVQ